MAELAVQQRRVQVHRDRGGVGRGRRAATFWNGLGVSDDEQGVPVFVVTGLRSSWVRDWPAFRNYG